MNSESRIYTVAIVGAGRIGSSFDAPDAQRVLTHAHAIKHTPRTELVALVDVDGAREQQARTWDTAFFTDIERMLEQTRPDIVVIATPDETHAKLLERLASAPIKAIVCEKPVCVSAEQFERLRALRDEVPVVVNFSRRFDTRMQRLREDLLQDTYGAVISASGIYTKGIFHNGSHLLDLARFLFGEMRDATSLFSIPDYPIGAPTVGGVAVFERCPRFFLIPADARAYAIFELDIVLERARIRLTDEGRVVTTQVVVNDPVYAGFKILGPEAREETDLESALLRMFEHVVAVADGSVDPSPSLIDALATHQACARFATLEK